MKLVFREILISLCYPIILAFGTAGIFFSLAESASGPAVQSFLGRCVVKAMIGGAIVCFIYFIKYDVKYFKDRGSVWNISFLILRILSACLLFLPIACGLYEVLSLILI